MFVNQLLITIFGMRHQARSSAKVIRRIEIREIGIVSIMLLSAMQSGCDSSSINTSPPLNQAAEDARSAAQALDNLFTIDWMFLTEAIDDEDQQQIAMCQASICNGGDHAFEQLSRITAEATESIPHRVLAAKLMNDMAAHVTSPNFLSEAAGNLLDLRDLLSVDEQKETVSLSLSSILSAAYALNPQDTDILFYRGDDYLTRGDFDLAIADLDRAILLEDNFTNAHYFRGLAYRGKGDHEQAIVNYSRALSLEPDYADIYLARAISYKEIRRFDESLADLDKAIKLNPKSDLAINIRDQVLVALGRLNVATDDL